MCSFILEIKHMHQLLGHRKNFYGLWGRMCSRVYLLNLSKPQSQPPPEYFSNGINTEFANKSDFYIERTVHRDILRGPCIVIYWEDRASLYIERTVHHYILRGPCIIIYWEDRASWDILITKLTRSTNFSNLYLE